MNLESVKAVLASLWTALGASVATAIAGLIEKIDALPEILASWAVPMGVISTGVLLLIQIHKHWMAWRLYRMKIKGGG